MLQKLHISQIVRYGYSGFLLCAAMGLLAPKTLKPAIDAAGDVVAPLTVFAVGAAVYVMYRYVIGEFILFPLSHLIHFILDKIQNAGVASSSTGFLREKGIGVLQRRAAYTTVRRNYFEKDQIERLDWNHTEVHLLYLTAVIAAGIAVVVCKMKVPPEHAFSICITSAILFWISALVHDISLHKNEARLFRENEVRIIQVLKKHGFAVNEELRDSKAERGTVGGLK